MHCVVWAKELFKLLFGKPDTSHLFEPDESKSTFMALVCYLHAPTALLSVVVVSHHCLVCSLRVPQVNKAPAAGCDRDECETFATALFDALYFAEINKKLSRKEYKVCSSGMLASAVPLTCCVCVCCAGGKAHSQTPAVGHFRRQRSLHRFVDVLDTAAGAGGAVHGHLRQPVCRIPCQSVHVSREARDLWGC